jgi:hypothetical protein
VLVLAAGVALRFPVLRYTFFADDHLFLDQVRGTSLLTAWSVDDPLRNYWRPLSRQLYFWLVSRLGESPLVAHVLNAALFLGVVVLVWILGRRLAGERGALVAAGIVALHEAADVPVLWASGSQDLLAILGALGALCLAQRGRLPWASAAFVAGLLSKETVAVTPAIALWMLRERGEAWSASLRRVLPLFLVLIGWFPVWLWMMSGGTREGLRFGVESIPAAVAHLPQVFLGAQWDATATPPISAGPPPFVPLALILLAVVVVVRSARAPAVDSVAQRPAHMRRDGGAPAGGVATGLVWAALASLPVAIVVHVWSSYFYLYAVCGLALAGGAWLDRMRLPASLLAVSLVAWGSETARGLESFATEPRPWGTQSHLTRFYFDRSMRWVSRYLEDLRSQLPAVPPNSTFYFAGTPAFASWQSGDGALVRWVYREPTIRSHYFADFDLERARRGEVFVFTARNDSLLREPNPVSGLLLIASGQVLAEHFDVADAALTRAHELAPGTRALHYWRAWVRFALGDSSQLSRELEGAGCASRAGPSDEVALSRRRLEQGDAEGALQAAADGVARHALDPAVHARLAELLLRFAPRSSGLAIEALATRLLTPTDPVAWRTWALVQRANDHNSSAYDSWSRYVELSGGIESVAPEDRRLLEQLRAGLPGGELAQRELRRRPSPR